jgi:hypothetical protein
MIRGLTDREERFPEIGQIRKGSKKDANGQMGKDLTYFRVEFDEKEVETIAAFTKLFGDKPTELLVMLAFNDIDRVWDAWYEAYTAGRLVARADGEFYTFRVDTKTNEVLTRNGNDPIPFTKDDVVGYYTNQKSGKQVPIKCKPVGRLRVVVPALGRLAYLTVMTTSIHDIINLSGQIQALAMFNGGRIAGIPLILKRRPKEISCPRPDGTRARYSKWMLSIEADPEWVAKSLPAMQALSLPEGATAYLPAGTKNITQGQDQDFSEDEEDDSDIPGVNDEIQDGEFEPTQGMTFEQACAVTTQNGTAYGTFTNQQLEGHKIGITKKMKGELTQKEQDECLIKLEAIKVLMAIPEGQRLQKQGQPTLV